MGDIVGNILLGLSLAAPIGPASLAVIQSGLKHGFWRALWTGIGVTAADLTYLLVVYFGLAGFISLPLVKISLWSFGALVLLYLGIQSIRDKGSELKNQKSDDPSRHNPLLVGYAVNISNPLAIVFWLGIYGSLLSSMLETSGGSEGDIGALWQSATILIGILLWHISMAAVSNWGKGFLNQRITRLISIVAGLVLALFGIRFGYYAIVAALG